MCVKISIIMKIFLFPRDNFKLFIYILIYSIIKIMRSYHINFWLFSRDIFDQK